MLVHESALSHGIEAADAIYAAQNWVFAAPQNDDTPMPEFRLGFDSHGRLELLVANRAHRVASGCDPGGLRPYQAERLKPTAEACIHVLARG